MDSRTGIYELAAVHGLDALATRRLRQLAGLGEEPAALRQWLPRGIAVLAAALCGFGVMLWIAANWDDLGRFGRFALLQGFVVVMCLGAFWRPAARAPLGLLALLGVGALFAYFGQTYQTGADSWQLFALWAVLSLPLCLSARSDVLWVPWLLVAFAAVSLWTHAHTGHAWRVRGDDLFAHGAAWASGLLLATALGRPLHRFTGAGIWGLRTAVTLLVIAVTLTAMAGLFATRVAPHYLLGLMLLGGTAVYFARRASFDIFALSAIALGLDSLLVTGLARLLMEGHHHGDPIGQLLLIGLMAAGLLAGSVTAVMRVAKARATMGEGA